MDKTRKKTISVLLVTLFAFTLGADALVQNLRTDYIQKTAAYAFLETTVSDYYETVALEEDQKSLYQSVFQAFAYQKELRIFFSADQTVLNTVSLFMCLDNPFCTITGAYYTIGVEDRFVSQMPFQFSDSEFYEKMQAAYAAAETVINEMPAYLDEYDIAKYLHDYVTSTVHYTFDETDADADTAYGALVNHEARCEGYANSYMLLLNLAGIENAKVLYFAEDAKNATDGHMWNLVKINGNYYHVDTTNDSTSVDVEMPSGYVSYAYFLISTEDILKTSPINATISEYIPACDAETDNYFIKNDLYFTHYNRTKIGTAAGKYLKQQLAENLNGVSFKFKSQEDYEKLKNNRELRYLLGVIARYDGSDTRYFQTVYNDDQLVVTISAD